jgi:hypothetical protein
MFGTEHSKKGRPVRRLLTPLILLLAGLALLPATSGAASTTYVGGSASDFATSSGNWQSDETYTGLCLQGITCPTMDGQYVSTDGAGGAGDGFIRTTSGPTTLAALLSESVQVWSSPTFTYNGIDGKIPASLTFNMSKRSGYSELIALGASADMSVTAVNQGGGPSRVLVPEQAIGTDATWQTIPEVPVVAGSLTVGEQYRLEIRSSIGGLASVLPAGNVDYDNVNLIAADAEGPGGGPGGGGGDGGTGGGGTDGGGSGSGAVLPPPKVIPPGVAYLYKNKLFIRVKCPKKFKPRCRVNAVALTKKKRGKVLTKNVRVTVKSKRFVRKGLQVKPKFRAKVKKLAKVKRKTLTVRLKIRSKKGKKKGTVFNKLRVIERRK